MKNKILTFLSAKGGVGKSQIVANFAQILANAGYSVAVLEVPNFNNQEIILNAKIDKNQIFVFANSQAKGLKILPNLTLIAPNDGVFLSEDGAIESFLGATLGADMFDFILIDASLDYAKKLVEFDTEPIVVCANEPCAISNTYAFLKSLNLPQKEILFLMNFASCEDEAVGIFENLKSVAQKNLGEVKFGLVGFMPYDKYVFINAQNRELFSISRPFCKASIALRDSVSRTLVALGLEALPKRGAFGGFLGKLSNLI
ncbi:MULTISPECIES: nucleotide-binding protein [unclassified Campylobacter]|uniref:nucleotide-binding protein n=1 Tax=unclassified Campylobacter TaxID=2593542 RepID=UPI0022E9F675|nr:MULTISPECIES: P-loop NTPase [unclassified Campylobacter]MDA3043687.1 P-loop NTPase [Campylobacter sp. JMF_09 ED2]MDA3045427.1 P-loop NTPase [Campylobacter sp. JMF_07 ED4]MDA3064547.1 P-loop NTPase [Campylobacter sp. JMF_11 EL3]MDA3072502.1 P-loop NTPase [Campylobacter sp. VBCF_03 NA9]MDA3075555.1 P-loop NTPase [Campylobacter sp. JMF_05 ED3]